MKYPVILSEFCDFTFTLSNSHLILLPYTLVLHIHGELNTNSVCSVKTYREQIEYCTLNAQAECNTHIGTTKQMKARWKTYVLYIFRMYAGFPPSH